MIIYVKIHPDYEKQTKFILDMPEKTTGRDVLKLFGREEFIMLVNANRVPEDDFLNENDSVTILPYLYSG